MGFTRLYQTESRRTFVKTTKQPPAIVFVVVVVKNIMKTNMLGLG